MGRVSAGIGVTGRGEERLADLLELSYEPMLVWRLDGPIEFWNAGAQRLYGFASDEAIGRSSHALLQTKFPVEFVELRSRLRNDGLWSGELRHVCKDGREVIIDSRMQVFADDTVLEVNRDVTERKHLEAALCESEQRLRWLAAIVEFSDDAIVSKNLDGIITSWNRGAERIFGYTAEEAIGRPITIVIPQDRLDEERTILARIRRGEHIDHFETVRRRKQGSLIAISLSVSPVKDTDGTIVGASKIARDITEQKRAQEQIACRHGGRPETGDPGAHPGARERPLAICRHALGRCRVVDDRRTGTRSVFGDGRQARENRRAGSLAGAQRRSIHCGCVA
jgi:PAS domain S-box-containing protein